MDLRDIRLHVPQVEKPVAVFSPHPLLLSKDRELVYIEFLPNETILKYLQRTGIFDRMGNQSFMITLDGFRVPPSMWGCCRPKPGSLVNLFAVVHGGDDKNPLATIAFLALALYAPEIAAGIGGPAAGTATALTTTGRLLVIGIQVFGGMVINAIFPPPRPDLAKVQNLGGESSPTYAIEGGSNRLRRYEPMPFICGEHRVYPDFGTQPFNEFHGQDQIGYYVFDFGYNDLDLSQLKIGDTPIEDFPGIEIERSGSDGVIQLMPGNVDSLAGEPLVYNTPVSRTSSVDTTSLAVELSGNLFRFMQNGIQSYFAPLNLSYRVAGGGGYTPVQFVSDQVPETEVKFGQVRIPQGQYNTAVRRTCYARAKESNTSNEIWLGGGGGAPNITIISASANVTPGLYWLVWGIAGVRWQAKPGGPGFATGPFVPLEVVRANGGYFMLYNGDYTQNLLIHVDPAFTPTLPDPTLGDIEVQTAFVSGQVLLVNGTREPVRAKYLWKVPEGQYDVQVEKKSPDDNTLTTVSQLVWSQLRSYQLDTADYTSRLRLGVRVPASSLASGTLQQLSALAKARTLSPYYQWAGSVDNPVLAFDFLRSRAQPVVGESSLVCTRAGATATRVNDQGLIEVVAADTLRWDYDPATLAPRGLLIEPTRTNLPAKDISASPWADVGTPIVTANSAAAPDGTSEAITIEDNDAASYEGRQISVTVPNDSATYTISVYVQKTVSKTNTFGINANFTGGTPSANELPRLNTNSGVASGATGVKTEDAGDYWRLIFNHSNNGLGNTSLNVTLYPATGTNSGSNPGSDNVAAVGSAVVWGPQFEVGSEATSYIHSGSGSVTRNADQISEADISAYFSQSEGSIFVEAVTKTDLLGDVQRVYHIDDGTTSNRHVVQLDSGVANASYHVINATVEVASLSRPVAGAGVVFRSVASYKLNDFAHTVDGAASVTDVSGTPPTVTRLNLGVQDLGLGFCGWIRKFAYYNTKLAVADAEIISTGGTAAVAVEVSSNPAWWFLNVARGKFVNGKLVYGAGLPDSRIDFSNLQAFADWCDAEGLTFDGVFDRQQSVYDMLSAIALIGRGTVSWSTGKLGVIWDADSLPVTAMFGMHNIVAGSFRIEYSTESLADAIEAWFIDKAGDWERDFVRAPVPGATSQIETRRVELFGCTNRAMAVKLANLYAAANAYRTRRYAWKSDWEAFPVARGDVVLLSHDLVDMDYSGRFAEGGSTTVLKLPKKVPLFVLGGNITIRKPDGTFSTHTVSGGTGDSDTLTASPALPFNPWADADGYPPYDYRWHYGESTTNGRKVKIESLKPSSLRIVEVTAIDEDPAYYAAKDNLPDTLPPRPVFGAVVLESMSVTTDGVPVRSGYLVRVYVNWDVSGDYGFADVRASINSGPFSTMSSEVRGRSTSFDVPDFVGVTVEVTVYSKIGRVGKSQTLSQTLAIDFSALKDPSDVTGFASEFTDDGTLLTWDEIVDIDRDLYDVRVGTDFDSGEQIFLGRVTQFLDAPRVNGSYDFWIKAIDAAGKLSINATQLNVVVPTLTAPTAIQATVEATDVVLTWDAPAFHFALDVYDIRYGASFAAGTSVGTTKANTIKIPIDWLSSRNFWIAARDLSGQVSAAGTVQVTVVVPDAPSVSGVIAGENVTISFTTPTGGTLPVAEMEVRHGASYAAGTPVARVKGNKYTTKVDWSGNRTFWVAAYDANDNEGAAGSTSVVVTIPNNDSAVQLTAEAIDNNVLLKWTDATRSLPLKHYEVRRGDVFASATVIGTVQARFSVIFETSAGTYKYWVVGVDSAGNYGVETSVSVTVSAPPDYILYNQYNSTFSGTKTNTFVQPEDGKLLATINTTEQYQQHFTNNSWDQPQDQIDAGFPIYIEPSTTTGQYYEEIDLGTVIASTLITASIATTPKSGTVTITPTISFKKLIGDPWTDNVGVWQVYATDFRYIKITLDFTSSGGDDLVVVDSLTTRLDVKIRNDSGTVTANSGDTGGTTVSFNIAFIDVQSITVTPQDTGFAICVVDFTDTPNPTSFKVLVFDINGNRLTRDVRWHATGA